MKFNASSWFILINKYIEMHGQQNIKTMGKFWIKLWPRVDSSRIQVVWGSYNKKWSG